MAKIITRKEVADGLGKWGPGLRLCCDQCGGKGMEAVAEFIAEGAAHHVCLTCLDVARANLMTALKTCDNPTEKGS